MAQRIAYNAKVQRPGVCNAAETLLVHADIAPAVLPGLLDKLREAGVELRVDARTRALAGPGGDGLGERDRRGLGHGVPRPEDGGQGGGQPRGGDRPREPPRHRALRGDRDRRRRAPREAFTSGVDAACVYVNASTRFTDGGEFGMGAEMGNSTQKLHARGPIALRELTTSKYVVHGTGQVRE